MNWHDLGLRLRALLSRRRVETELDEELQFHLAMQARKHRLAGADAADASREAQVQFGTLQRTKEECRDIRGLR